VFTKNCLYFETQVSVPLNSKLNFQFPLFIEIKKWRTLLRCDFLVEEIFVLELNRQRDITSPSSLSLIELHEPSQSDQRVF